MQQFFRRQFGLYPAHQLNAWLKDLGFNLDKPGPLAAEILKLSNIYNEGLGSPEVWQNKGLLAAYLVYFQPLNYLRLQQVIEDGMKVGFWQGISQIVDYGAGLGTFELALKNYIDSLAQIKKIIAFEPSLVANEWQRRIGELSSATWTSENIKPDAHFNMVPPTLFCFSYSLNEMPEFPKIAEKAEALLFLEPSTLGAGRRLQELRGDLIKKGFFAWAPCLHQQECPLLKHSQRDWCHNRIHIEMPDWFLKLEQHLPMKNSSITYSYLLARKTAPPTYTSRDFRVIGDTLFEKGKVRQAICQNDKRQFFGWLTKMGEAPTIPRGTWVKVTSPLVEKSDEIRPEGEFTFTAQ